jgi:PhnB protein
MKIVPNLHFNGDCEQAIKHYERAFKAQTTIFLRYRDARAEDVDEAYNDEYQSFVYHSEMLFSGQRVILNDHTDDLPRGTNVSLLVSFDCKEDVIEAYTILKDGAKIITPMQETSYSSCFVSLIDRYGVRWELIKEI